MAIDLLVTCPDKLRHKYFSIELTKAFPNSGILIEQPNVGSSKYTEEIQNHFDQATVSLIQNLNPKVTVVHGTSIIKLNLISLFSNRLINLHAGLSPYYRGSGTNVFPFYNRELEYVGMTIHYINEGIDTGDIILQARPEFEKGDNTHTIGCKSVILGTELMKKVVEKQLTEGKPLFAVEQKGESKYYKRKDFTEEILRTINQNLKQGLVEDYIQNPKKIDLIEW